MIILERRWEGKHEEPSTHVASPWLRLCKAVLPSAARPQNINAPQRAERGRPPAARQAPRVRLPWAGAYFEAGWSMPGADTLACASLRVARLASSEPELSRPSMEPWARAHSRVAGVEPL